MEKYIEEALNQANKALLNNDTPVGAVIVKNKEIIGKGYNDRNSKKNVLGHAEINAIIEAQKKLKDWRLNDCEIYVTLEPCSMCMQVLKEARISKIYFLTTKKDQKKGYSQSKIIKLNSKYEKKYSIELKEFFEKVR